MWLIELILFPEEHRKLSFSNSSLGGDQWHLFSITLSSKVGTPTLPVSAGPKLLVGCATRTHPPDGLRLATEERTVLPIAVFAPWLSMGHSFHARRHWTALEPLKCVKARRTRLSLLVFSEHLKPQSLCVFTRQHFPDCIHESALQRMLQAA